MSSILAGQTANLELAPFIQAYGLSAETRLLAPVHKGVLSQNYIVGTPERRYFLKRYRFDEPGKVARIHAVKRHFCTQGVPVIMPVIQPNGATWLSLDDGCHALFPFVEGRELIRAPLPSQAIASAARLLARMHLSQPSRAGNSTPLVTSVAGEWNRSRSLALAEELLEIIAVRPDKSAFDRLAEKVILRKRELVTLCNLRFQDLGLANDTLCHGDYHSDNMFFDDANQVQWLFDWEKAEMAPRIYEIVRAMDFICINSHFTDANIARAGNFLREYHEKNPLTAREVQAGLTARYVARIHSFWVEGEHYLNNNTRADHFLEGQWRDVEYGSGHLEELTERLLTAVFR